MPYRLDELGGFAPKTWVPRFSVWVSENSAVGRMDLRPTIITVVFFAATSRKIVYPRGWAALWDSVSRG